MARPTPSMEMFMVGAYLQLVEACDTVTYNTELPNPKEFWVEVVGRSEANQCIFYVDFPEKFDWYPPEMRPETLVKKLVQRYVQIHAEGGALDYEPGRIHCQVWIPRVAAPRVLEALPKVQQRLREQHGVDLEVIEPAEVARRVPVVVERAPKSAFDYDNLFVRALLIAQGRLDYQVGAPMDQEQIEAMYRFPRSLRFAAEVPAFVYEVLTSPEIVHWLDFYAPTFDDLAYWMREVGPVPGLGELEHALGERGEVDEGDEDEESEDYGLDDSAYQPRRYSARDVAELTRIYFNCIDAMHAQARSQRWYGPLQIEIDFMLPFISRVQDRIDPSVIEREILRYGGNRDEMVAHFATAHADKRPYRAILRIEFLERGKRRPAPYSGGKHMEVPIANPALSDEIEVAVTINYAEDFTGYVVMMMHRLAAGLDL